MSDVPELLARDEGETGNVSADRRAAQLDLASTDIPSASEQDPVVLAARQMLQWAITMRTDLLEAVFEGAVSVVVEVPSANWVRPIADAWESVLQEMADPQGSRPRGVAAAGYWLTVDAVGSKTFDERNAATIALSLSSGESVVGISQSPDRFLPRTLLRIADFRIVVAPLKPEGLSALAAQLTGLGPSTSFPEELCRLLEPEDLRLARRPSQDADAYLAKLQRLVQPQHPQLAFTLDDLYGMPDAVVWGQSLAMDLKDYASGRLTWADVDKGACLYGPPGTGKTTFARALAGTCGVPLITGSLYQWQAKGHLGDLLKAMRRTFDEALKSAPSILFVDELDSFGDRDGFQHDYRDYSIQVVNGFLEEVDGVAGREGVVLLAACNNPSRLDPAIVRSGRLDRMIPIALPDRQALVEIFRHHVGTPLSEEDLTWAATLALGGTGADVERWSRGAKRRARADRRSLSIDDLVAEISGALTRTPKAKRICAVHESGHAVALVLLLPESLLCATIRATTSTGGGVVAKPDAEIATREIVLRKLMTMLAGRAAEEIVFGEPSGNSGGHEESDLAKATSLAARMLFTLGFDDGPGGGLLWLGDVTPRNVDAALRLRPTMESKVVALLADAYSECKKLLQANRKALDAVAQALMDRETLSGAEVEDLVRRHYGVGGFDLTERHGADSTG